MLGILRRFGCCYGCYSRIKCKMTVYGRECAELYEETALSLMSAMFFCVYVPRNIIFGMHEVYMGIPLWNGYGELLVYLLKPLTEKHLRRHSVHSRSPVIFAWFLLRLGLVTRCLPVIPVQVKCGRRKATAPGFDQKLRLRQQIWRPILGRRGFCGLNACWISVFRRAAAVSCCGWYTCVAVRVTGRL